MTSPFTTKSPEQKKDEVLRKYAEELVKKYGFEWTELAKEGWDSPIAPISGN